MGAGQEESKIRGLFSQLHPCGISTTPFGPSFSGQGAPWSQTWSAAPPLPLPTPSKSSLAKAPINTLLSVGYPGPAETLT